ncbi:MAG: ribulose-phosphate 3-epimerase [Actinomycetaceae bacterium]|nr:ribulose-phosphate 3-epimerase [Actinomycetaceae bacterium]
MRQEISPSILNCDIGQLHAELDKIATADNVHVDVMDNHFVPNLSWGLPVVESVVKHGKLPVDVHLMIEDPDRWALDYAKAGVDSVTFHAEAATAPVVLARQLRAQGVKAGLGLRPATPIEPYIDLLKEFDMILIMTVEPGFGGQEFIEAMCEKIRRTRKAISRTYLDISLQVDGGISRNTIEMAAQAGANVFVAGSAVYKADNAANEIATLRKLAKQHCHGLV